MLPVCTHDGQRYFQPALVPDPFCLSIFVAHWVGKVCAQETAYATTTGREAPLLRRHGTQLVGKPSTGLLNDTYNLLALTLIFCFVTSKSTSFSCSPGRSTFTTMKLQCVELLSTSLRPRYTSSVPTACFSTMSNLAAERGETTSVNGQTATREHPLRPWPRFVLVFYICKLRDILFRPNVLGVGRFGRRFRFLLLARSCAAPWSATNDAGVPPHCNATSHACKHASTLLAYNVHVSPARARSAGVSAFAPDAAALTLAPCGAPCSVRKRLLNALRSDIAMACVLPR